MFWKFNILTSNIDTVLEKENVTLREIMDEDDVLQECKGQNRKLIEFLTQPQHIDELVRLVLEEPPDDVEEKWKYKYSNIACELLTSDFIAITEKLASNDKVLDSIYAFLASDRPTNPLMASFFSKLMGLLIARKSELMLQFLQSKEEFVSLLMKHLGTSAIMDLLLRLITCIDNSTCRTQCIRWLDEQKLIQKLVALIDPQENEAKHCNASQCLCDVIRISREQMSQLQDKAEDDPLLATLESSEVVGQLLDHMFAGEDLQESVLVNGITVLQTLLEFRKLGPEGGQELMTELDTQRLARGVHTTIQALIPRLADFHRILINPPKQYYSTMRTTVGVMEPPLGNSRLQVVRLLTALLGTNRPAINAELHRLGTLQVLLDLNFRYEWNNFLHQHVEQSIACILSACPPLPSDGTELQTPALVVELLREQKLPQRVLQVWEDNLQAQQAAGGHRKGYMGYLTKIINHVEECRHRDPDSMKVKDLWQELPEDVRQRWDELVTGPLADLNKQNSADLVSTMRGHGMHSSSEDDDADFRDVPFPQDSAMQQAFSDYQLQQMTSTFVEQLGFNDDEFTEPEARIDVMFTERISSINFDIPTEDAQSASSLFEQKCSQRLAQFGDFDADDDMWEEKELTFSKDMETRQKSTPQTSLTERGSDEEESEDSEEDLDSPKQIYQHKAGHVAKTADSEPDEEFAEFVSAPAAATAMDTGVKGRDNSGLQTGQQSADNWAHFDSAAAAADKAAGGKEGWADFTSLDKMGGDDASKQRSSSPLAMEVDPARPTSYLVDSVTRELAMEVSESGSPDKSLQTTGNDSTVAPAGDKADPASSSTENRFISYTEVLKLENEQSGQSQEDGAKSPATSEGKADSEATTGDTTATTNGPL